MPSSAKSAAVKKAESELRKVLRRCMKAAETTRASIFSSCAVWGRGRNGINRTTAESTLGAGLNAIGGTSINNSLLNRYCAITDKRL